MLQFVRTCSVVTYAPIGLGACIVLRSGRTYGISEHTAYSITCLGAYDILRAQGRQLLYVTSRKYVSLVVIVLLCFVTPNPHIGDCI